MLTPYETPPYFKGLKKFQNSDQLRIKKSVSENIMMFQNINLNILPRLTEEISRKI